jgi:hypothetical protein
MRTLLCHWYGEAYYEEDVPREKLIEMVKHLHADLERTNEQFIRDLEFFSQARKPLTWYERLLLKL